MKTLILFSIIALALARNAEEAQTCLEEHDGGMCRGYFEMYYYDYKSRSCKLFVYGGCGGNGNKYATEEECMDKCGDVVVFDSESACDLPAETGMCRGYFPRYHFDRATGKCQKFIYGGCGGNENNFGSEEECQSRCGSTARATTATACQQEKVVGPCKAYFERYFFNKGTGRCEKFVYGGCQGNSNNFHSQEDCEAVCVGSTARAATSATACQQEKVVGPCRAYFERYFFNKETGKCERFVYGGCRGNSNNFHSQQDCEAVCVE